jgi:hypothetical protein
MRTHSHAAGELEQAEDALAPHSVGVASGVRRKLPDDGPPERSLSRPAEFAVIAVLLAVVLWAILSSPTQTSPEAGPNRAVERQQF